MDAMISEMAQKYKDDKKMDFDAAKAELMEKMGGADSKMHGTTVSLSFYRCLWLFVFDAAVHITNEKKRSERRKHCALAVVRRSQKISPHRRPLPGGAGRPKFNQLEMVTTFTYKPSLVRIDARNFELSLQQTHKQTNTPTNTHKPTYRTDYNSLRRS